MYVSLEEGVSLNVSLQVFLTWRHLRKVYPHLNEMGRYLHSMLGELELLEFTDLY